MTEPGTVDIDWIARHRAEPGDTIIMRLASNPTQEQIRYLAEQMRASFPDCKVVVLGKDATLEVVNVAGS